MSYQIMPGTKIYGLFTVLCRNNDKTTRQLVASYAGGGAEPTDSSYSRKPSLNTASSILCQLRNDGLVTSRTKSGVNYWSLTDTGINEAKRLGIYVFLSSQTALPLTAAKSHPLDTSNVKRDSITELLLQRSNITIPEDIQNSAEMLSYVRGRLDERVKHEE